MYSETLKSKFIIILLTTFLSLNIAWNVFAKENPEDEFYSTLSKNEQKYKEYQNATLNIRRKINDSSELRDLEKELAKYGYGDFSYDYPDVEVYFFASIYEDKYMVIRKYAVYDIKGNFLNGGFGQTAKRDAVNKGEFNGWKDRKDKIEEDNLADDDPTD